jgi:hypothetical protein
MDYASLLGTLVSLVLAGVGGLAWLFKLHGNHAVLREKVNGEVELRKALEARVNGFEQRVYEKLDEIIDKLSRKADR